MSATILVVDDDRAFRELVVDILRLEGYRTVALPAGLEEGLVAPLRRAMAGGE